MSVLCRFVFGVVCCVDVLCVLVVFVLVCDGWCGGVLCVVVFVVLSCVACVACVVLVCLCVCAWVVLFCVMWFAVLCDVLFAVSHLHWFDLMCLALL